MLHQKWDPAQGLQFHLGAIDGGQGLILELNPGDADLIALDEHPLPDAVTDCADLYANRLPTNARERVPVVIKVRPTQWTVYVANRPVASSPPPFPTPARLSAPITQLPPPDDVRVRFQRVEETLAFQDNFLVPEEEENVLSQWEILAGKWDLHTALDTVLESEALPAKSRVLEAERSPNFYSLQGAGANALIVYGYPFLDAYDVEAAMQVSTGEMGIAFYLQDTQQFHAFTIRIADSGHDAGLRLWRQHPGNGANRETLAAARTPLTPGQWIKLKVRTYHDRIVCSLDGTAVIDSEAELPVGGAFGLFIDSNEPARFDDVRARSNRELDLRTKHDIRRHLVHQEGKILPGRRLLGLLPPAGNGGTLEVSPARSAQWIAMGSVHDPGHAFTAEFTDISGAGTVGLIAGFTGPENPYFRFTRGTTDSNEIFRLERAHGDDSVLLERLALPAPTASRRERASLMSDATSDGELRLYRDGELVLVHHGTNSPGGASGVFMGARTGAAVPTLRHAPERTDCFHSRYEKNPLFSSDPYMLHWSSPGGQWITMKDGLTWHRGDFFGRFFLRMPYVAGSEIHLGVAERETNGVAVVSVTTNNLALWQAGRERHSVPTAGLAVGEASNRCYTVHYEDHWLWVTTGEDVLFKQVLEQPLAGTRIRIKGFTQANLKYSYVERHNMKDFLFTESSHDWIVNGGRWDVVNRFQCDPRWSHMNGESTKGLAALWGKYRIEGDFCIELYAGIRHGTAWYKRCGDLNLTVQSRETTPSQGYTVTCTGWDFDHSQRLSRLFREGEVVQESDKYLVPRSREGNVRRGHEPMIPLGTMRDVHGAWYYMKLRRIGQRVEYFFDNERIFSYDDPQPLDGGLFGVWTYLNSMVIARINVAASKLVRRPVSFESVPPNAPRQQPPPTPTSPFRLVNHDRPLELSTPGHWKTDDPVGRARMTWGVTPDNADAFSVETVLGSGPMAVRCMLPPVPYEELAGWRFYVKRTPRARFNFHYSVGSVTDGEYTPKQSYFHRLSGTGFSKGKLTMTGETEVPGTPATNTDWRVSSPWTAVDVWIPPVLPAAIATNGNLAVKLEGFGNLQPSFIRQGLYGNGPGEAYAVRGLTEIRYQKPRLALTATEDLPLSYALLDRVSGQRLHAHGPFEALQSWIDTGSPTGLVRGVVLAEWKTAVAGKELSWVSLPPAPVVGCRWGRDRGDQVELLLDAPYPDRRFSCGTVAVGGETVHTARDGFARRIASVPRIASLASKKETLEIALASPGKAYSFALRHDAPHPNTPPVLLKLDGPAAFFENFEHGELRAPLDASDGRMRIRHSDPEQGAYLEVFNPGAACKLKQSYTASFQLSCAPVFQFRYKAEPMSQVTLYLGYYTHVRLAENYSKALPVRHGQPLEPDGAWHTWTGIASDAVKGQRLSRYWFTVQRFGISSLNTTDQTGLHSTFAIDDIVVGPAVSSAGQLGMTPHYYDRSGQPTVLITARQGPEAYAELPPEETVALVWDERPNGQPCIPSLHGLTNGICHLFIKARAANGAESAVTDIPFLLDREPDKLTYAFRAVTDQLLNGSLLDVTVETDYGAPVDLRKITLSWNGAPVRPLAFGSTFTHSAAKEVLSFNWPFLLREQISTLTNTQTGTLVIGGIVDGAGNPSPDLAVPIKVDYASDKTPPTMLEADYPSNIVWCAEWEERSHKRLQRRGARRFGVTEDHEVGLVTPPGHEPFFQHRTLQETSEIWQDFEEPYWRLAASPHLCLELRRPNMEPGDKTEMYLLLETPESKRMVIWLTPEREGKDVPGLPEPIKWKRNRWHTVNVNLMEMCKKRYAPKVPEDIRISRIRLRIRNGRPRLLLQVRNVFAFGKWRKQDAVRLSTYDASGIAGTAWTYATGPAVPADGDDWHPLETTRIAPAFLPEPGPKDMWIVMKARDRADNLSVPMRVPVAR